jgi:hypothetical protein
MATPRASSPSRSVSAVTSPLWPGITTGRTAHCQCSWAPYRGVYQIKAINMACPVAGHRTAGAGNA